MSPSSRKRKRLSLEDALLNGEVSEAKSALQYFPLPSASLDHPITENENSEAYAVEEQESPLGSKIIPVNEGCSLSAQRLLSVKHKSKKGKRKGKKIKDEASPISSIIEPEVENPLDMGGAVEHESLHSNGEDVEMEDAGESGEVDSTARNEEGCE